MSADTLRQELWFAQRLTDHRAGIFDGLTDRDTRRERFRAAILDHGLTEVIVGRQDGKPATYAQAFEQLFGEPLTGNKRQPRKEAAPPSHKNPPAATTAPTQLTLGESP